MTAKSQQRTMQAALAVGSPLVLEEEATVTLSYDTPLCISLSLYLSLCISVALSSSRAFFCPLTNS